MPTACRCGTLEQSKREGGYHRSIDPLQVRAVQNVLMPLVGFHDAGPSGDDEGDIAITMTMCSTLSEKIHRGLTGHSDPKNIGFSREAISLVRAATFLLLHDRLEVADSNSPA